VNLPRDIDGDRVVRALVRDWGYVEIHRAANHAILETQLPLRHRLSVPTSDPLRIGTLNAILRAVAEAKQDRWRTAPAESTLPSAAERKKPNGAARGPRYRMAFGFREITIKCHPLPQP
jgi:hypothetical protein